MRNPVNHSWKAICSYQHAMYASPPRLCLCEDRIGAGPPRARTQVFYVAQKGIRLVGNKLISAQKTRSEGPRSPPRPLQGYLANTKTHPPPGTPEGSRHRLTVGSWGNAFSYGRGSPVHVRAGERRRMSRQGYLAHKGPPHPRTLH